MLAYAAHNRPAGRAGSPRTLLLIITGHAVLIGAALTVKMQLDAADPAGRTTVVNIPIDPPPPPPEPQADPTPAPQPTFIERPVTVIDMPPVQPPLTIDQGPPVAPWVPPTIGDGAGTLPVVPQIVEKKRTPPIFRTADSALRPPYPNSKLRLEEEATLRLRLSIDANGRVTAVEPVGSADPEFLAAARRHIIRAWRYKPATEDGAAVATTTVITLSFRLEDA